MFPDIQGHWARYHITVARAIGLVKGYEDGTFRPNNPINRAEATVICLRTLGYAAILAAAAGFGAYYFATQRRAG
ncbi:MAG: S-layer homology domain-containing protein [Armatimonadota bacterium]